MPVLTDTWQPANGYGPKLWSIALLCGVKQSDIVSIRLNEDGSLFDRLAVLKFMTSGRSGNMVSISVRMASENGCSFMGIRGC